MENQGKPLGPNAILSTLSAADRAAEGPVVDEFEFAGGDDMFGFVGNQLVV